MNDKLTILDLFSGIGGFSLGLERTKGFKTIAFCEINPFCQQVLKKHWPGVKIHDDIKTLKAQKANVITIGFPCTQTSVAASISGKRKGLKGPDSGLWFECKKHIEQIKPEWVLVENPIGIKRWESEIKGWMESVGYTVSRLEFTASDFGLPHLRRRYVYVANASGKRLEITRQTRSPTIEWYERLTTAGGAWLSGSPGTVGIFNGLPNRMDRVKALGNTINPNIPEFIGNLILEEI